MVSIFIDRKKCKNDLFMSFIRKGFRVYDGYFIHIGDYQGGDYPAKFSVLSKKPMNKKSMQKLMPVCNRYDKVHKNAHGKCNYVTFNGETLYELNEVSGNVELVNANGPIWFSTNFRRSRITTKPLRAKRARRFVRDSRKRSGHAVVRSHNKFLLLRKSYGNPNHWHCPGGIAKHNERRIDAAIRETYEETGCRVTPVKRLRNSCNANYYLCQKIGGHAHVKSHEILEVKWFSLEDVKELYDNKKLTNCNLAWFELSDDHAKVSL